MFWILIGANDLTPGECSEEAIILGILRLADEIAMVRPGSVVVIQGLLPRTPFFDGSLTIDQYKPTRSFIPSKRSRHNKTRHKKQFVKPEEYPLWPSIQLINKELERFCEKHEHMVYFDAASLFLGSMGNEHFQSSKKVILKELMPDYAHLSLKGHKILAKVMAQELNRIIYDKIEDNYKTRGPEDEE